MSYTTEIKLLQDSTRQTVMLMLNWNDLQYGNFQFNQGEAYLEHHIGADVWGVKQIRESAQYWAWWRNQWFKRDQAFIELAQNKGIAERHKYYARCHDVEHLEIHLHHSFSREIIGKVKETQI